MKISSPAFIAGEKIPTIYTCDGENISPPLEFFDVPLEAVSLALIVEDPDAPGGLWTHWTVWNIPPNTELIPSKMVPPGTVQGLTSYGAPGYGGPCPPAGSHRYFFRLFALDRRLDLGQESNRAELEKALMGHIIAETDMMGTYEKNRHD
mgnify:CR=1 FL=1